MSQCLIFGGAGYIGTMLAEHLARDERWHDIVLADVRPPARALPAKVRYVACNVREPITGELAQTKPDWIFNFAAVHREPGHEAHEYFDTNLSGARNVCALAEATGCERIFFTSSIAVYGPTRGPTDETTPTYPKTPYGISKLCAELIHESWLKANAARRLVICRPGVIYGPGDPGNILRMIRAVKRGYFFFPGSLALLKSYGYVFGLAESIEFMMARPEPLLIYNYVESETEPIRELVRLSGTATKSKAPSFSLPLWLLVPAAHGVQFITGGRSPIHPMRVRKAATATHIVPRRLAELGFDFRYDFARSLEHWKNLAPEDFA